MVQFKAQLSKTYSNKKEVHKERERNRRERGWEWKFRRCHVDGLIVDDHWFWFFFVFLEVGRWISIQWDEHKLQTWDGSLVYTVMINFFQRLSIPTSTKSLFSMANYCTFESNNEWSSIGKSFSITILTINVEL